MTSQPPDKPPADAPNLLTLAEASRRTGLTVDALRKRIRRGHLEVVKGNDGLVRIRLPASEVAGQGLAEGQPPPSPGADSREIKALEAMAEAMRERAEKAEAALDKAWAEAAEQRSLTNQAEREREAARIQAARAEGEGAALREALARDARRLEQSEAARQAAEAQREAAQVVRDEIAAELANQRAGGPLVRAWRGFWRR